MTYRVVHRPARSTRPQKTGERVYLEPPPVLDQTGGKVNFLTIVPLLGAATSMTVMMLFRGSPFAAVGAIMMVVTVIASILLLFTQRGKARRERQVKRDAYLEYLDDKRREFTEEDARLRASARVNSPEFALLPNIVRDPARLWERRRGHSDFLRLRLGVGERPVRDLEIRTEAQSIERPDYFLAGEAENVRRRYSVAPGVPCEFSFRSLGEVTVVGPREAASPLARQIMSRAAVLHSPEDLYLALVVPEPRRHEWEWAASLPHVNAQDRPSRLGPLKRVYTSREEMAADLRGELLKRAKLAAEARKNSRDLDLDTLLPAMLVVDLSEEGPAVALASPDALLSAADLGLTCVRFLEERLHEPDRIAARFTVTGADDGRVSARYEDLRDEESHPEPLEFMLEDVSQAQAQALSRLLAPLRLAPDSLEHNESVNSERFTEMLSLNELSRGEIERNWGSRSDADFLRIPLGPDDGGKPLLLDLKESAQLGMGPHGLCVGATGSGKSELLRTIVLALMTTHSPERLNMVLVDFKGGATFAPFEGAPHVSGIITNLSEETSLIDRVHDSLAGEILRRQEVLKAAGNIANVTDYELHRREASARGEEWAPLPHLLVIIDEFGELLTAQPDFIDLFLSIGRIGRSIGVHLMLSSQRIESGKLRGLDTYLSYRLGLRTLSEAESRTVLDTPDAFHLPAIPGYGYLKVDTTVYDRFKAGFVSGPLPSQVEEETDHRTDRPLGVLEAPFGVGEQQAVVARLAEDRRAPEDEEPEESERTTGETVMSHLVDILREFPRATSEIWLPPLPNALALDTVLGEPQVTAEGFAAPTGGALRIPVGLLDDPSKQWQGQWDIDLTRAGGSVAFIGGPQTGKSTALRTLALSAALTHSPSELALYGVDLKGSALLTLEQLPHVGGVGVRTVRENVRRTVEEVHAMLIHREEVFERYGLDSLETMRERHRRGEIPELPVADIVLLIDGYGQIADEFEEIEKPVHEILARGSGYGVHVVATATRWNEIRIAQQSFFGSKVEFRMTEPSESVFGKKKGEALPVGRPGRALQDDSLIGHFALPRMDGEASAEGLADAFAAISRELAEHTDASCVAPVRVLPQVLPFERLDPAPREGVLQLGLVEHDFSTQFVSLFGRDRHLLVMGDSQSGKTNLVRSVLRQLVDGADPDSLVVALFDPRQELDGAVPDEFLGGHAKSSMLAQGLAASIAQELENRVPKDPTASGPVVVPKPRIVLVLEDYDVLTSGGTSPLAAIAPFVSMASEIGLHVIMTRKVAGASRGMFESVTAAVRESGAATFLMDGDRTEGALVNGVRARHFPPGRGLFIQGGRAPKTVQAAYDPSLDKDEEDYE
ncbi:type VII secretion protein EccCa [Falsarthrobacter nasiphocae]|uniref:S-DNA-T family DNA segregation ATPase FtsK/SpoIIIE n=1 Tax=Falsarthrobacter nasiphocae TaxID=189863 RepID=A0AAE3YHD7_9MICC|nr:type VII secretion protein EccCa [Falsarthrobacter nasiphocae]MDR6892235.1 S-DNA-T family DNA segregation ATPase FtsK/SpoIIIE [Falsarthrobacter nasiphocae]